MRLTLLTVFLLTCLLRAEEKSDSETSEWFSPKFMKHSLSYLHGNTYEFSKGYRDISTLEHLSVWEWGQVFAFGDYTFLDDGKDTFYYEIQPKLSLSYVTGNDLSWKFIKDVYIATEFNHNDRKTTEVYLAGLGLGFDVPGFQWLNLNAYWREDVKKTGDSTYQITANWGIPLEFSSKFQMRIDGFVDIAGAEAGTTEHILFVPQITVDVGRIFNKPDRLYVGVEYSHWENKFGVNGIDEEVWQFLVKYYF